MNLSSLTKRSEVMHVYSKSSSSSNLTMAAGAPQLKATYI